MYHSTRTLVAMLLAVILTSSAVHAQEEVSPPVTVGTAAPDFTLGSEEGEFTLSSLEGSPGEGGKYAVLVFARAHW